MNFVCKVWIWYVHQFCSHSLMGIQINDTINYRLHMCPEREGNKIGEHKTLSCHNTLFIHRILVFLLYIEHTHILLQTTKSEVPHSFFILTKSRITDLMTRCCMSWSGDFLILKIACGDRVDEGGQK